MIDITYPTFKEILKQLSNQLPEAQVNLSTEELEDLSRTLSETFEQMKSTDYQGFAKSIQPKPAVSLHRWQTEKIRDERKSFSKDFSTIDVCIKQYKNVDIHIVNVWGIKRIQLHFVCPITDEEAKTFVDETKTIMARMNIPEEEQANLMAEMQKFWEN